MFELNNNTYFQHNLTHKFSFASDLAAIGVYKIEDYVVEYYQHGYTTVVLIFICPDIRK